jgi:hypothetical protein
MLAAITALIAINSPADLPAQDVFAGQAVAKVNAFRKTLGFSEISTDPKLTEMAVQHTNYLVLNKNRGSHQQIEGKPGFVAKTLGERAKLAGIKLGLSENISGGGFANGAEFIDGFLELPYHREPYLYPGLEKVGMATGVFDDQPVGTILLGRKIKDGVVVYPYPGQDDVPSECQPYEVPDPLRMHRERKTTRDNNGNLLLLEETIGYPITYHSFPTTETLEFGTISLTTDAGELVPSWVNTPANDTYLKCAVIVMPKSPLTRGAKYNVSVEVKGPRGKEFSRAWSFTVK